MRQRTVNEFIKDIRKYGRKNSVTVTVERGHGKGSHGRIFYGSRYATIKSRGKDLGTGLQAKMLKDLGINPNDM